MEQKNKLTLNLKSTLLSFLLLLLLFTTSCLDDESVMPVEISYLSIYHASPDTEDLNIIINSGSPINNYPFKYGDFSGYLGFYPGQSRFKFSEAEDPTKILLDTAINIGINKYYSVFVANSAANIEAIILNDSSASPASGKAMVRFVHMSPDAPEVDVNVEEEVLFTGRSFKEGTPFTEVTAETTTFSFMSTDDASNILLTVPDVQIGSGKFYTIILNGFLSPPEGNDHELSMDIINN